MGKLPNLNEDEVLTAICCPRGCQLGWRSTACQMARDSHVTKARAVLALLSSRTPAPWQPIKTRPPGDDPCWIGDSLSGSMIVARPAKYIEGTWRVMWADKMLPWKPDLWQPLPEPPQPEPVGEKGGEQ